MSYHCPKCGGNVLDRTSYVCSVCGADLPPESLFRPPDMPEFDKLAEGRDVQLALLSEALRDRDGSRSLVFSGQKPTEARSAIEPYHFAFSRTRTRMVRPVYGSFHLLAHQQ